MPERFVEFAHPAGQWRETYQFRSSWLASSLRALRTRSLIDAYRRALPEKYHAPILESVAGVWLPIDVAVAHYEAIDALAIPTPTVVEMGREIHMHAQSILAQLALRTSRGAGVTPWSLFGHFRMLWDRTWRGGDFAIDKIGPKETQVEIVAWTVAPSSYVRHAMRGVFDGLVGLFCEKCYVRDVPHKCRGTSLAYRIAWA